MRAEGSLSKVKPDDHLIELRDDGMCFFKSYTTFQFDSDYVISRGRWQLIMRPSENQGGKQQPALEIMLTPAPDQYVGTHFWIAGEKGQPVLWAYIGDPDRVQYADFRKTPKS